jgi:hypothetical protein
MNINLTTALITSALVGSILLALKPPGGRLVPAIALVASAIAALMAYKIIQLSAPKLRLDVVIPGVLVVAGGLLWSRSATKPAITAATVVTIAGAILLLGALRALG